MTFSDGPRFRKLNQALEMALEGVVKDCSYDRFAQSFPQLSRDNPMLLSDAREHTVNHFKTTVSDGFNEILEKNNIKENLNSLDNIIVQQQVDDSVKATLTPEAIVAAHRISAKRKERLRLLTKIDELSQVRQEQINAVNDKHNEIRAIIENVRQQRLEALPRPPVDFDAQGQIIIAP